MNRVFIPLTRPGPSTVQNTLTCWKIFTFHSRSQQPWRRLVKESRRPTRTATHDGVDIFAGCCACNSRRKELPFCASPGVYDRRKTRTTTPVSYHLTRCVLSATLFSNSQISKKYFETLKRFPKPSALVLF